ncbi:hypothetical protein NT6N_23430 [Oceaniferula spumae]|uniref:Phosphatidylinositol diacylglycerol-lyase n=1 Tax=Oceaniferula spumae TaxID=2979115 RepID=A0AAT9FMX8_9BACT
MLRAIVILLVCLHSVVSGDERRYDQVTWLCTHNAMNAADDGWRLPNQTHTITKQLDQGVRALMLDVWKQDGELVLRHGPELARFLGYKKLSIELANIHAFLTKNPQAVVTLIFESYVPAMEVAKEITDSKLAPFCHFQDPAKPWPSIANMLKSGKRLVVFSDRVAKGTKAPSWYMPIWSHAWETNWQAKTTADLLAAKPRRGKRSNKLFILNHFVTNGVPSASDSKLANSNPFLQQRIDDAVKRFKSQPNFLVLNFYHLGDGAAAVKLLNQKEPAENER